MDVKAADWIFAITKTLNRTKPCLPARREVQIHLQAAVANSDVRGQPGRQPALSEADWGHGIYNRKWWGLWPTGKQMPG